MSLPEELRQIAITIAREAGAVVSRRSTEHLHPDTKSTATDVVTEVDRDTEKLIRQRLADLRPGDGMLGEEGTDDPGSTGVRWIVDPLDGTVNYLYGIGAYSVSIAAELDGQVVAGAVYDAATGVGYDGVRGGGSYRNGVRLACSDVTDLGHALLGTGFGYDAQVRADQGALIANVLPRVRDIRRIGSAALDMCWVAGGVLDAYFERGTHEWDRAAGLLIAEEAGARFAVIPENGRDLVVLAPPAIFDELFALVTPQN